MCGNSCVQFLAATKLINPDATHPCAFVAACYARWWVGLGMSSRTQTGYTMSVGGTPLPAIFQCTPLSRRCPAARLKLERFQVVDGVTLWKFQHDRSPVGVHRHTNRALRPYRVKVRNGVHHNDCYHNESYQVCPGPGETPNPCMSCTSPSTSPVTDGSAGLRVDTVCRRYIPVHTGTYRLHTGCRRCASCRCASCRCASCCCTSTRRCASSRCASSRCTPSRCASCRCASCRWR